MTKKSAIFLTIAGLLIGGLVGGYIALPNLAERFAVSASERLGTRLGVKLSWESFHYERNHSIEFDGVSLNTLSPTNKALPKPIYVERVAVSFDPISVLTGRLRLKGLEVDGFTIHLVRDVEERDNYSSLVQQIRQLQRGKKGKSATVQKSQSGGWSSWIAPVLPQANFRNGRIILEDRRPDGGMLGLKTLHLDDAYLNSKDKSLVQESTDLQFEGAIKIREFNNTVRLKGFATYPRLTYGLSIALDEALEHELGSRKVRIGGLGWSMDSDLELQDVRVGARGDKTWDEDPTIQIGKVQVSLKNEGAKSQAGDSSSMMSKVLSKLESVTLVSPKIYVERYANRTMNLDDVAARFLPKRVTPEDEQPPQKAMESLPKGRKRFKKGDGSVFREGLKELFNEVENALRRVTDETYAGVNKIPLRSIQVKDGTIRFVDELLFGKNFLEEFHNFDLSLESDEEPRVVTFKLAFESQGTRNRAANEISGRVHLDTRDVQVHLGIRNLDLGPYNALFPSILPIQPETVMTQGDMDLIYNHEREVAKIEGLLQMEGVSMFHPAVAPIPLTEMEVDAEVSLNIDLASGAFTMSEGIFGLNEMQLTLAGEIEDYRGTPKLSFELNVPTTDNQKIVEAMPSEFIPKLKGLRLGGQFGWSVTGSLDTGDPESLKYKAVPTLSRYKLLSMGEEVSFKRVRGPFQQRIQEADDMVIEFESGPGSDSWVPYDEISPWMTKVVTTTEDGAFFRHKGVSTFAMRDSLITNIERGGFYRGASTISQQLVKNLFLGREKTLSRKFQELFITWEMEKVFEKEDLLALYFNVIEFGPEIYGIRAAADHYFAKLPSALNLVECLFLGSLIPNPKKYYFQFTNGQVTENWRKRLAFFGKIMRDRKKIDESTYEALKPFRPRFVQLGPDGQRIIPGIEPSLEELDEELFIPAHELDETVLEEEGNMAFDEEIAP